MVCVYLVKPEANPYSYIVNPRRDHLQVMKLAWHGNPRSCAHML